MKYLLILLILLTLPVSSAPLPQLNNANTLELNYKINVQDSLLMNWSGKFTTDETMGVSDLKYRADYSLPIKGDYKLICFAEGGQSTNDLGMSFNMVTGSTTAAFSFSQKLSDDPKVKGEGVNLRVDLSSKF